MTDTPLSSLRRRKKLLTYGKKASPALRQENLDFFDDDQDELALSYTPAKRRRPSPRDEKLQPFQRLDEQVNSTSTTATGMPIRKKASAKDSFDVPSSDEEDPEEDINTTVVPRVRFRSKLVDDRPRRTFTQTTQSNGTVSSTPNAAHVGAHDNYSSSAQSFFRPATSSRVGSNATERLKSRLNTPHNHVSRGTSSTLPSFGDEAENVSRGLHRTSAQSLVSSPRTRTRTPSDSLPHEHTVEHAEHNATVRTTPPQTPPKPNSNASVPSTPTLSLNDKTDGTSRERLCLTPKQSRLWDGLLELVTTSESVHGDKPGSMNEEDELPTQRIRHNGRLAKRMRMADRLGGDTDITRTPSQDLSDSDSPRSAQMSPGQLRDRSTPSTPHLEEVSQQVSKPHRSGRLTYMQQRSHLAEDDLGEAMMLDVAAESDQQGLPRKRHRVHESTNFDFDESETEGKTGKVKSIHELRAAGQSSRLAAEIEDLLQDITNHSATAENRRKIALVRLAVQILDESTAKRFLQDGHDKKLASEMRATDDTTATAIFTSILISLFSVDMAGHALDHFPAALTSLLGLLKEVGDVKLLLMDRTANPSIIFRKDAATYFQLVHEHTSYWPDGRPSTLTPRLLYLRALDLLARRLQHSDNPAQMLDATALSQLSSSVDLDQARLATDDGLVDGTLTISILESLSISASPATWPTEVITMIAELLATQSSIDGSRLNHLRFLAYRLGLNITNDTSIDHFIFAKKGSVRRLFQIVTSTIDAQANTDPDGNDNQQQRKLQLDLLVLAIGILINLTEHSRAVRRATVEDDVRPLLLHMLSIFRLRHETAREVESEDESAGNVAYGYVAVLLANLCQDPQVRQSISEELPGKSLRSVVEAVEEFVLHHQRVDTLNFAGEEGQKVWSSFTARLEDVLVKLRSVADT